MLAHLKNTNILIDMIWLERVDVINESSLTNICFHFITWDEEIASWHVDKRKNICKNFLFFTWDEEMRRKDRERREREQVKV